MSYGRARSPIKKLKTALASGVQLMRGAAWFGLPSPVEIRDPALFVQTNDPGREQRQIDASSRIEARGVGKAHLTLQAVGTRKPACLTTKVFAKAVRMG